MQQHVVQLAAGPALDRRERYAADTLASVLGDATGSRLYWSLMESGEADHAPGGVENAAYISGTTLLGSLAALHRLAHPGDTATFERLFLSGQVQFPDLYPASFQHNDFNKASNLPVYPLPKTAQSCKRFPGFQLLKGEEVDDERHGVRDNLLDWAAFTLGSKANKAGKSIDLQALLKPLEDQKECLICKNEKKTKKEKEKKI